jgi:AcrR family transcriptional regulator
MDEINQETAVDETRQRILQAAAKVISQKGYARATTRLIAQEADVNEVTLFRHFGSKQNLLTALVQDFDKVSALTDAMKMQFTGELQHDLLKMGNVFFQAIMARHEAIRLLLCESTEFPDLRDALAKNPRHLRQMLAEYLEERVAEGRVRNLQTEVMAQMFWGMFFTYGISVQILKEEIEPPISTEALVANFVDVFMNGIVP